jgi:hypothetical protein
MKKHLGFEFALIRVIRGLQFQAADVFYLRASGNIGKGRMVSFRISLSLARSKEW